VENDDEQNFESLRQEAMITHSFAQLLQHKLNLLLEVIYLKLFSNTIDN